MKYKKRIGCKIKYLLARLDDCSPEGIFYGVLCADGYYEEHEDLFYVQVVRYSTDIFITKNPAQKFMPDIDKGFLK